MTRAPVLLAPSLIRQLREAAAREGGEGSRDPNSNRFVRLLRAIAGERKTCDTDHGGCGQLLASEVTLRRPPECFTVVLGWESERVGADDIRATLAALDVTLDLAALYPGTSPSPPIVVATCYSLRCVVCYYGQHYHAFVRVGGPGGGGASASAELAASGGQWLMFDDTTIKPVGAWPAVLAKCFEGHLQPSVLFYDRDKADAA